MEKEKKQVIRMVVIFLEAPLEVSSRLQSQVGVASLIVQGGQELMEGLVGVLGIANTDDHRDKIGNLQAEKEKLAAQEQAEIMHLNSQLADIDSDAQIKTWMLDMRQQTLRAKQAELVFSQESARLMALLHEKSDLETRYKADVARQSDFFFADPSYRMVMNADMFDAVKAFEEAQKWAFFTTRALEYKWNIDPHDAFTNSSGRLFHANDVFKFRNAKELENFMAGLANWDKEHKVTLMEYPLWHKFSVRQDFLGYKNGRTYIDSDTGETNTAIQAFQKFLNKSVVTYAPGEKDIVIRFSTVREVPAQAFFLGARRDAARPTDFRLFGNVAG